jgi:hypothetical protein
MVKSMLRVLVPSPVVPVQLQVPFPPLPAVVLTDAGASDAVIVGLREPV